MVQAVGRMRGSVLVRLRSARMRSTYKQQAGGERRRQWESESQQKKVSLNLLKGSWN